MISDEETIPSAYRTATVLRPIATMSKRHWTFWKLKCPAHWWTSSLFSTLLNLKIYTKALSVRICNCKWIDRNGKFGLTPISSSSFLCDCAINKNTREQVRAANIEYQKQTNALIDSGIYDTADDFTIVRQPFMEHMKVPSTVMTEFLSTKQSLSENLSLLACWLSWFFIFLPWLLPLQPKRSWSRRYRTLE